MNRPKRGRTPIKKLSNKKFNTLKHKRGNKKGGGGNQAKEQSTKGSEIQRFLTNFCQYLYNVKRGRQKGRKTKRLPLEGSEAGVNLM